MEGSNCPSDYWKELVRAPYALIAVGTLGAYLAHPYMQAGAAFVENTGLGEGRDFRSALRESGVTTGGGTAKRIAVTVAQQRRSRCLALYAKQHI